jgi:hypothetical protein
MDFAGMDLAIDDDFEAEGNWLRRERYVPRGTRQVSGLSG